MFRLSKTSSPGTGRSSSIDPDRIAVGVHLETAQAGRAAQLGLVDLLHAVLPDLVVQCVRLRRLQVLVSAVELVLRDLARVADDVSGEPTVGVVAHGDPLRRHRRQLRRVLVDPDLEVLGHVAGDGHRHVRAEPLIRDALLELLDGLGDAGPGQRVGDAGRGRRGARRRRGRSSAERSIVTCTEMRLSTMTLPLRSRMRPRGASTATTRIRFASAATCDSSAAMTCRYQSRANSAAKSENATIPRTERRRRGESPFTGTPRGGGRCPGCPSPTARRGWWARPRWR